MKTKTDSLSLRTCGAQEHLPFYLPSFFPVSEIIIVGKEDAHMLKGRYTFVFNRKV